MRRPNLFFLGAVAAAVSASASGAQAPVPVVFLPGLAEPGVWNSSGPALASTYNITAFTPSLTSGNSFQSQNSSLGTISSSTILVGHSAGGIVARLRGQSHTLFPYTNALPI